MRKASFFVSMIVSLFAFGQTAQAGTPDGETPANEGVCDGLVGSTPGLYGLCVAFCEAQDAEATLDATGEVTFAPGSRPSNPKILERFNKKKELGDPSMPCVIDNRCPLFTGAELSTIADVSPRFRVATNGNVTISGSDARFSGLEFAQIRYSSDPDDGFVRFFDESGTRIARRMQLSNIEALACGEMIRVDAASRGL